MVIKPSAYKKKKQHFPVVYLLHGYGGWYANWIIRVPQLQDQADMLGMIIVCPDGGNNWYYDSPVDSSKRYETHVVTEIVSYIDGHYRTVQSPNARAITGLSMGGHGGLFLGLRHPDIFGACGSMSGAVDVNSLRSKYEIMKLIGDTITNAQRWKDFSVYSMVEQYAGTKQKIIFDCGTGDFFYESNKMLHEKLLKLNIQHDYIERPGKHDWAYWANAVPYQLYYFSMFFKGKVFSLSLNFFYKQFNIFYGKVSTQPWSL